MLLKRYILLPWLLSSVIMFGLSYTWHGLVLIDMQELSQELFLTLPKYLLFTGVAYLVIGLVLTLAVHKAIQYEWISLKGPFPLKSFLLCSVLGLCVYLLGLSVYLLGFAPKMRAVRYDVAHGVADALWQMFEQGMGGLMVALGIIYDLHQRFLEHERAN